IHSRIRVGDYSTEVFERVTIARRAAFAEVTKNFADQRIRTRISVDGNTLTARVRGSASGVATQTLEVPEQFFLSTPSIATQGWCEGEGGPSKTAYGAPFNFQTPRGSLGGATYDTREAGTTQVPAGEFQTTHFARTIGGESSELWVEQKMHIPVRCRIGAVEYVLTSMTS